jgi:hypothetical protein
MRILYSLFCSPEADLIKRLTALMIGILKRKKK